MDGMVIPNGKTYPEFEGNAPHGCTYSSTYTFDSKAQANFEVKGGASSPGSRAFGSPYAFGFG
jgi:hypothetical protein